MSEENGLGRVCRSVLSPAEWEVEISEDSWCADLWTVLIGARITSADAPEHFVTLRKVDVPNRTLVFEGPDAFRILKPSATLYFYNPDSWRNPKESLHV